jgi:hypothetical protein
MDQSGNYPHVNIQLPGQKWNNIVLTYNDSLVDVFTNGELAVSHTFDSDTLPEYRAGDSFSVGDGDGTVTNRGLYGAICNVNYYKVPLEQIQVVTAYNALQYTNPPTNA